MAMATATVKKTAFVRVLFRLVIKRREGANWREFLVVEDLPDHGSSLAVRRSGKLTGLDSPVTGQLVYEGPTATQCHSLAVDLAAEGLGLRGKLQLPVKSDLRLPLEGDFFVLTGDLHLVIDREGGVVQVQNGPNFPSHLSFSAPRVAMSPVGGRLALGRDQDNLDLSGVLGIQGATIRAQFQVTGLTPVHYAFFAV